MENLRQKFKIFNYRPLVLIFLGLSAGILVSHFITRNTILSIVGIVIVSISLLFYSILHKKIKYLIIFGLCFLLGFSCFSVYINNRTYNPADATNKYAQGVVTEILNRGSSLDLLLEDVIIDGKKVDYNVEVEYQNIYQNGYVKIEKGSKVKFKISSQSDANYYYQGIPNSDTYGNNIGLKVTTYQLELIGQKNVARYSLLKDIRNNLRKGLNNLNGEMIYSAMFGDKSNLNRDLYEGYRGVGVAHLLAVSGLHVGLVVAILYWIFKKLHINGWIRLGIIVPLLFVYAYLCGFSYSVIRASIMSIVLITAPLLFSQYDLLSSICFAGSIILLIQPVALFDLSAQLSFGCVIGICLIYPIFKRWFAKIHISNPISDSFCISLATIISTFPFMAYYFGYIQPIGLISNILLIPIFGILFTIAFIMTILSLILPFISFVLILVNPLFEILNWFIIFISNHSRTLITPSVNYLTIILFYILLTFASKFNIKKGINKMALVSACSIILMLQLTFV